MTCAPDEDSGQPRHPHAHALSEQLKSLIRNVRHLRSDNEDATAKPGFARYINPYVLILWRNVIFPTRLREMSRVMRKPTFWFLTWSDTNHAVQLQEMTRGLKFRIKKVEGLY